MDLSVFARMPFTRRACCVVCERRNSAALLDMPKFPITEIYTTQRCSKKLGLLDQEFFICPRCGHGQLGRVIDVGLQYGNYHFRSGQSATGQQSAQFFINYIDQFIPKKKLGLVVEVGCNDLYLLKQIRRRSRKLVGIDPILSGREKQLSQGNVHAVGGFLEDIAYQGSADLIICKDTLEHVSRPVEFLQKVVKHGHARTLYAFQFPLLETLLAAGRIDQIFHQHVNYFSMRSIMHVLDALGLELVGSTINYNLWGSIIIVFRKTARRRRKKGPARITGKDFTRSHNIFMMDMTATKERLRSLKSGNVYGYGAALMLPVLDYYLDGEVGRLKCIMDDDITKKGLRYINLDVDIKPMHEVHDLKESAVVLTAIASLYNVRAMLGKLSQQDPRQIIVPLHTL
jgi:hypothetical protein